MKDLATDFAQAVATRLGLSKLATWWYQLTAYYPRKIAETEAEIEKLKFILTQHFGLKDDPRTWATVFGQMTSVKATSIRKPYSHYANAGKRLYMNETIQGFKMLEINKLHAMLEEKMRGQAGGDNMPDGSHDTEGSLSILRPTEEGVVPAPGEPGV